MVLQELPPFGFFNSSEMIGQQFHALEGKIGCVAESRELKHIDDIVDRHSLRQPSCTSLLQLWYQVNMGQGKQVNPIFLHLLLTTPANEQEGTLVIS